MQTGYSRLLVYENAVPDVGADSQATALDLMMMNDTGLISGGQT